MTEDERTNRFHQRMDGVEEKLGGKLDELTKAVTEHTAGEQAREESRAQRCEMHWEQTRRLVKLMDGSPDSSAPGMRSQMAVLNGRISRVESRDADRRLHGGNGSLKWHRWMSGKLLVVLGAAVTALAAALAFFTK